METRRLRISEGPLGAAVSEPGQRPFDVGVVFVHGIGHQDRGETLDSFSQPLTEWLRGHLAADEAPPLRQERSQAEDRAAVEITIGQGADLRRVVMTEAWWARSFAEPSYTQVVRWLSVAGPLALYRHAMRPFLVAAPVASGLSSYVQLGGLYRWLAIDLVWRRLLRPTLFVLLALPVQLLAIVLIPLALIPIVRRLVLLIRSLVTRTLGDSFALIEAPDSFDVMVQAVVDAWDWLGDIAGEVVIVAHSQGAAVTHEALKRHQPEHVTMLITLGAGIDKLLHLRGTVESSRRQLVSLAAIPAATIIWMSERALAPLGLGLLILAAVQPMVGLRRLQRQMERDLVLPSLGKPLQWLDLYATADPVPNGALHGSNFRTEAGATCAEYMRSVPVDNRASLVFDHTTYLTNDEQVIGTIGLEL